MARGNLLLKASWVRPEHSVPTLVAALDFSNADDFASSGIGDGSSPEERIILREKIPKWRSRAIRPSISMRMMREMPHAGKTPFRVPLWFLRIEKSQRVGTLIGVKLDAEGPFTNFASVISRYQSLSRPGLYFLMKHPCLHSGSSPLVSISIIFSKTTKTRIRHALFFHVIAPESHFLVLPKDFLAMIMPLYYRYFPRNHISFISTRHALEHLETISYRYSLVPQSPEKPAYLDRSCYDFALAWTGTTTCTGKTRIELPACYLHGQMLCKLQATQGKPILWAARNAWAF